MRRAHWIALPAVALAVALALALASTPAHAARIRLHGTAASAPAWDGLQVLVALDAGRGSALRAFDADGSSTFVASIPRRYSKLNFAISPQLLAVHGVDVDCNSCKYNDQFFDADDISAASPGGPLHCVASIGFSVNSPAPSCLTPLACPGVLNDAVVSGETLAWASCNATERPGYNGPPGPRSYFTAVEQAAAPATPAEVSSIAYPEALAGEWLVGLAPGWRDLELPGFGSSGIQPAPVLVERNLITGTEPLRIPLPAERYEPFPYDKGEYPAIASVEPDGTVAYALGAAARNPVYVASPSAPGPREIAASGPSAASGEVWRSPSLILRGGLIAERHDEHISIERLDGTRVATLRTSQEEGFDFDGARLAIIETPCTESFLETWSVGEAPPSPIAGRCSVVGLGRSWFAHGAVKIRLHCPATPALGCGWSEASVEQGGEPGFGEELVLEGIEMLPGASRTVSIPVPRAWVRRHRGRKVGVGVFTLGHRTKNGSFTMP